MEYVFGSYLNKKTKLLRALTYKIEEKILNLIKRQVISAKFCLGRIGELIDFCGHNQENSHVEILWRLLVEDSCIHTLFYFELFYRCSAWTATSSSWSVTKLKFIDPSYFFHPYFNPNWALKDSCLISLS